MAGSAAAKLQVVSILNNHIVNRELIIGRVPASGIKASVVQIENAARAGAAAGQPSSRVP